MLILDEFMTNIANAIRKRTNKTDLIKAEDFAAEIEAIPQELTAVLQSTKNVTITSNGTTNITPDSGYDGLAKTIVTTDVQPNLQTKTTSLTSSSATEISPDNGYDGLSKVTVTPTVQTKSQTITTNGTTTITPDSGKVGLSSVSVTTNVQPNLQTKSTNITSASAISVTPDSGYNGLSKVTVTPVTETRTHNVTANGTTTVSVNSGKVGMTKVTVNTNVSSSTLTYKFIYFQGSADTKGSGSVSIPAAKTSAYLIIHASTQGDLSPSASGTGLTISRVNTDALGSPYSCVNYGFRHSSYVYKITKTAGTARTLSVSCSGNAIRFSSAIIVY